MYASRGLHHLRRGAPALRLRPASVQFARSFSDDRGLKAVTVFQRQRLPANLGFVIVPQQSSYIVERLGRFHKKLESGLHLLIPLIDKVAYVHNLKEQAIPVANQKAITRDNTVVDIDGVLYMRIVDAEKASYGVSNAILAVMQLAQTTMRSELGKISLDKCFEERENLNLRIVESINTAAEAWGVQVLRYEIKDITPPPAVKDAMDGQAEAERRKRAQVLRAEAERDSAISKAEGLRTSAKFVAEGEAEAMRVRAAAAADSMRLIASALEAPGGREAVTMRIAEQYIDAFSRIAKAGNTLVLPADAGNPAGMVAQALSVWSTVSKGAAASAGAASSAASAGGSGSTGGLPSSLAGLPLSSGGSTSAPDANIGGESAAPFVPRPLPGEGRAAAAGGDAASAVDRFVPQPDFGADAGAFGHPQEGRHGASGGVSPGSAAANAAAAGGGAGNAGFGGSALR